MHGDGCATVVASAIRVLGERLVLVGTTSDTQRHPVGKWSRTRLFGRQCDFFPVMSADDLDTKYVKNLSFTLNVIRHWGTITDHASETVLTQNYAMMWWLAISAGFRRKVFYLPGMANQILIGRKPRLGRLLAKLYEWIQISGIRKMDLVVAAASVDQIDTFSREWADQLGQKRIHQLPTSVDVDFFKPLAKAELRHRYDLSADEVYFVCVGRLAKVKGIDFLIDAMRIFVDRYHPASLLVVGDGEEADELRRHATDAGLTDRIRFLGSVQPTEVRDLVNCADVCVVGSHTEGFSCAMVEQIACGRPLVSTDVSGAAEIIEDGESGFILRERDPGSFAQAMHEALRLTDAGAKSREIAVTRYSERAIWRRFLELLENSGSADTSSAGAEPREST
jgi:glycosyltransferase involved in cell wall biosynthesis